MYKNVMNICVMELNVCSTEHNQSVTSDTFVLFENVGDNGDTSRSSIAEIVDSLSKLADAVVTSCSRINMF
jgi:microcompartment protein CcmK/EutM